MDKIKSMKRALLITGIYPPDIGGPATYVPQLELFLRGQGWEVEVLTLTDCETNWTSFSEGVMRVRRSLPLPVRVGITVLEGCRRARRVDVILANGLHEEAAFISVLSQRPLVAKVVGNPVWEKLHSSSDFTTLSEEDFINFQVVSLNRRFRLRMKSWLWALKKAKALYVPGIILKDFLKFSGLQNEIHVIPNAVPVIDLNEVVKEVDVVTVSRLVPWKNIDILIQSAKQKGFTLDIIGHGPQEGFLREVASGAPNIRFLGRLEPEEVLVHLKKARIFALLSSYEGMSFALVEALALGLPCVVSDIRSNGNVVDAGGGVKVPLRDSIITGEVIAGLLENEVQLMDLQQMALDNSRRNFNSKLTLERVERILSQYAR